MFFMYKRILVFSDTHLNIEPCVKIIEKIPGADMIIHAGDHSADAQRLQKMFPDIPIKYVDGNCDFSNAPTDLIFDVYGKKFFVTHGHKYNVKNESDFHTLKAKGKEVGADVIIFGHTHIPINDRSNNYILLNPGSVKYGATYGIVEIDDNKIGSAVIDC